MRVCSRCGQAKPEMEYYARQWTRTLVSGKEKVYTGRVQPCKPCVSARSWDLKKQTIVFLGGKCVECGETDLRVLQINHRNGGGTKENTTRGAREIWKDVIDGKRNDVDVRCANCNILYEYEVGRRIDWTNQDNILN